MSKVAAIINSLDEASNIKDYIDAYLVPLKDLSINYINTFSLKEIEAITKFDKEVFVVINKNIHNNELSSTGINEAGGIKVCCFCSKNSIQDFLISLDVIFFIFITTFIIYISY